jgi:GDPmannose 4,6-dehydratase
VRVLITGASGQDGFYLAQQLLEDRHTVYGMVRGRPGPSRDKLLEELPALQLVEGDLLDQSSLMAVLRHTEPEVVFNLGAITFVGSSWAQPALMSEVTGLGVLRLLEAVRMVDPSIRVVQASSSEMFGAIRETPQDEMTPLNPRSPYGVAKAFAHHTAVNYRESYGLHVSTAIMFNHDSPRRGVEFVTRKVTRAVAKMGNSGKAETLRLGNLKAERDWGWSPEFMTALPLIAAQDRPDDFVLATGEHHSVAELCQVAYKRIGANWEDHVVSDPLLFRPADVELLVGDGRKAKRILGFEPQVRFKEIITRMVDADLSH